MPGASGEQARPLRHGRPSKQRPGRRALAGLETDGFRAVAGPRVWCDAVHSSRGQETGAAAEPVERARRTWKGPWADSSSQWEDFPEVLDECRKAGPRLDARGGRHRPDRRVVFMEFSDFCSKFDTLHLCRLFDDKQYKQYKVLSSWAGKTAAGPDEGVPTSTDTGFASSSRRRRSRARTRTRAGSTTPSFG